MIKLLPITLSHNVDEERTKEINKVLEELQRLGFKDARFYAGVPPMRDLIEQLGMDFGFLYHQPINQSSHDPEELERTDIFEAVSADGEMVGNGKDSGGSIG